MANLFPCPSCGGQLVYNVKTHAMKCRSCGSAFPADEYKSQEFRPEREVISCPNCGGEVSAPSLDGMNFCPYCGTEITNAERFSEKGYPALIIPFGVSKKKTISIYKDMTGKVPFLPDELKSEDGLKSFVGLYTPYWIYDFRADGQISLPVSKSTRRGDYVYNYKADLVTDLGCDMSIGIDASQTLDDTVSEKIEPFNYDKLEDFNPNYMAGFYAENSTVNPSVYKKVSADKAGKAIYDRLEKEADDNDGYSIDDSFTNHTEDIIKSHITRKEKKYRGAYLPIWFLTTKKNNRVAYTVINGQTGAAYSDLPVDIPKYLLGSVALSVIIAIIFMCVFGIFGTMNIRHIPYITMTVSSIMMIAASLQSNRIHRKENHLDDLGYDGKTVSSKIKERNNKKKKTNFIIPVAVLAFILIITIGVNALWLLFITAIIVTILQARGSTAWTALLAGIGAVLSAADIIINPPSDAVLYGLMIVTLLILILDAVKLTKDYNRIATNPLPQFGKSGGRLNEKYD